NHLLEVVPTIPHCIRPITTSIMKKILFTGQHNQVPLPVIVENPKVPAPSELPSESGRAAASNNQLNEVAHNLYLPVPARKKMMSPASKPFFLAEHNYCAPAK